MPEKQDGSDVANSFLMAIATAEEEVFREIFSGAHIKDDRSNNAPAKGVCRNCDYPIDSSGCRYC